MDCATFRANGQGVLPMNTNHSTHPHMKRISFLALTAAAVTGLTSCGGDDAKVIQVKGSDTMIQLASAWSEAFGKTHEHIKISASGGGSGGGIKALINGTTDLANSSRRIKDSEKEEIKKATGKDPVEHVVSYDALAVFVHPSNPLEQISVEELSTIWAEGGGVEQWEQVGGSGGKITLVGRNSSSGTYEYFREHICGKGADGKQREFRKGVSELVGSTEVIETISKTPTALGYSGMGYKNSSVKWLKVSNKKGEPAVEPGEDAARDKSYPIARELYIYTLGEPTGDVKTFLDWVKGPEGQAIVSKEGFVAVTK
jgi:phosphate transport system substrate-binding protein